MISPIQLGKTYGVLHTKSFFSFLGFAKKVGSDEIQKIDVFLDNKLIDTIEANGFIQKIDDMYDVENKAFTYNLPTQYMGKKATISFKNHSSQDELLNSPYILIDKNHEKFNEASFFNTLNFEFDNEKIQNINPKDSIGFLATEDNILNKDLIKLINIFLEQNLDTRFKVFYFNNEQKKLISEKFNKYLSQIDFIIPKDIYDIPNNISIYIHSSTANKKPKSFGYHKLWQVLNQTKANMFMINIFEEIDDKDYSKSLKLIDNYKIGFEKSVVSEIFKNDERYNELCFMNSLNQPIDKKMKNVYKPNSIGFLATKENLEDENFIEYIKELMIRFPKVEFKAFYFDPRIISSLNIKKINLIEINNVESINTKLFIFNAIETYDKLINKHKELHYHLLNYLKKSSNVLPLQSNYNLKNKNLEYQGKLLSTTLKEIIHNFFTTNLINKYSHNFYLILFQSFFDKNNIQEKINLTQDAFEFATYSRIKYLLEYDSLFKEIKKFEKERLKK